MRVPLPPEEAAAAESGLVSMTEAAGIACGAAALKAAAGAADAALDD